MAASRPLAADGLVRARGEMPAPGGTSARRPWLLLAGGFEVVIDGSAVQVPLGVQRLLAYLALADRPVPRSQCAGALWENGTAQQAGRNLRTTLWRLKRSCGTMVQHDRDRLGLVEQVEVDAGAPRDLASRLLRADQLSDHVAMERIVSGPALLPTWSDTWIVIERERLRLLWLHALESAANELAESRPAAALFAAMAAVQVEPLQESAWRLVVAINLRQGNVASAHRAYAAYRTRLAAELGVTPSMQMEELLAASGEAPRHRSR